MKKLLSIFCVIALIGAFCIAFTACTEPKKQEQPEELEEPKETEDPEQPQDPELSDAYYWGGGGKIPLEKIDGMFHVMFFSENEAEFKDELAKAGAEISNIYTPGQSEIEIFGDHKHATVEGDFEKIEDALSLTFYWDSYYKVEGYPRIWSDGTFAVMLKSEADYHLLEKMAEENEVMIAYRYKYVETIYYLSCTNNSRGNTVEMANLFHESGFFEWAEPNFAGLFVLD